MNKLNRLAILAVVINTSIMATAFIVLPAQVALGFGLGASYGILFVVYLNRVIDKIIK